jgi:hypothetical protein
MLQQFAVRGAPVAGVAFCAAPIAVPIEMVKEGWRERPCLGAMNASRALPGGRSRHGARCPCRCLYRGAVCPENACPARCLFLDAPRPFSSVENMLQDAHRKGGIAVPGAATARASRAVASAERAACFEGVP